MQIKIKVITAVIWYVLQPTLQLMPVCSDHIYFTLGKQIESRNHDENKLFKSLQLKHVLNFFRTLPLFFPCLRFLDRHVEFPITWKSRGNGFLASPNQAGHIGIILTYGTKTNNYFEYDKWTKQSDRSADLL